MSNMAHSLGVNIPLQSVSHLELFFFSAIKAYIILCNPGNVYTAVLINVGKFTR